MGKIEKKSEKISVPYLITLVALALVAIYYYGVRVLILLAISSLTALITDFICTKIKGEDFKHQNLSCIAEAWLLTFMFSSAIPFVVLIISTAFAVIVGRYIMGDSEKKVLPVSAIGYVFAVAVWKSDILLYPDFKGKFAVLKYSADNLVTSSSAWYNSAGVFEESNFDILTGNVNGPLGTSVILLLILCAIILVITRKIRIVPTISALISLAFFSGMLQKSGDFLTSAKYEVLANMVIFACIFIAGDRETAPEGVLSGLLYGLVLGMITYYITLFTEHENAIIPAIILCSPICYLCKGMDVKKNSVDENDNDKETMEVA